MKIQILVACVLLGLTAGCVTRHHATEDLDFDDVPAESVKKSVPVKAGIVVDTKDLQTMEKMTKALEAYVLKNETKDFTALCKDKRFDCFVDGKAFPKGKRKITRKVPPYASGSKMGLAGEKRIQARYDFYPN